MAEFRMPALGADMEAGVLVAWRRKPGDVLQRGDVIAEVETDKGVIEVEVWSGGVLERYLVETGQKVPVGTPLAILSDAPSPGLAPSPLQPSAARTVAPLEAAAAPTSASSPELTPGALQSSAARAVASPEAVVAAAKSPLAPSASAPRESPRLAGAALEWSPLGAASDSHAAQPIAASPAVRRRARELGLDLREVAARTSRLTMGDIMAASAQARGSSGVRSSPAARKRAQALGIALDMLNGTGPEGAVVLQDVERAAAARACVQPMAAEPAVQPSAAAAVTPSAAAGPTPASATRPAADRSSLRRAIAAAMARSKREIPHYYLSTTIDLQRALAWLSAYNDAHSVKERMLPGALLLKAVARACKAQPELNCLWRGDSAEPLQDVHVGVAVALRGGGLIAPAIHHTDTLALPQLMSKLQDLVARARTGALRSSELSDGTITVTSLGERGVESVLPIIYPPQTAIVGFGRIADRPWVVNGALAVRPLVTATLAADHRVTDGHLGARFLNLIDTLLQEPQTL